MPGRIDDRLFVLLTGAAQLPNCDARVIVIDRLRLLRCGYASTTMAKSDDIPKSSAGGQRRLKGWPRFLVSAIGTLALGLGTTAVFVSSNSLGTAILLGTGGLFVFMGVAGFAITRGELFGNSFDMSGEEIREQIEDASENFPTDVKETLGDIFRGSAVQDASSKTDRELRLDLVATYENAVKDALKRISSDVQFEVRLDGLTRRLDALLNFDKKQIAVEIKYDFRDLYGTQRMEPAFAILGSDDSRKLDGVLLVTNHTNPKSRELASGHRRIGLVEWISPNDDEALRSALEELASN